MCIRTFRPEDTEAIVECVVELQEYERALDARMLEGGQIAREYFGWMRDKCDREAGTIFVLEVRTEIAGFVAVQTEARNEDADEVPYRFAYISDLMVRERHRRRGLGRRLLEHARSHATHCGAPYLRIGVHGRNRAARALYESAGFEAREILFEQSLGAPLAKDAPARW